VFLAGIALLGAACAGGGSPSVTPGAPRVSILPDDPSRPYVVTAIDYHFHDAHPTRPLASGRTLIVRSQGAVRHNVTIPAIGFSKDVPPGGQVVIRNIGRLLGGPGRYPFFCKYHLSQKMRGAIVVSG
jgi:hypothetical protein